MILPFLQIVVPEVKRLARAIAVHDPQKRDARWWRVTIEDVWDYGVRVSGDKRPDGMIRGELAAELLAADVEYPGPPAELVDLLQKVDLLEVRAHYLRVKGVAERYGHAWDKQSRNSTNGRKGAKARWNHAVANGQNSNGHDKSGWQEGEGEGEEDVEGDGDVDGRAGSSGSGAPAKPRLPSFQQAAHEHFERARIAHLEDLAIDQAPDEQLDAKYINAKLKPLLDRLGGEQHPDVEKRFSRVVAAYLDRDGPARATPPWCFRIFASEKTWGPIVEEVFRGAA